jgi:hypothetical protein
MLTIVHPSARDFSNACSAPVHAVELSIGVIVKDEESQRRLVSVLREVEHRNVAVRVASRQQRLAACTAQMRTGFVSRRRDTPAQPCE